MLRSAFTSRSLALVAAGFLVTQMTACSSSGGGNSSGSGGSNSSSGGSKGSGGSNGSGGSSNGSGGAKVGSGGSNGSGGSSSSGGSNGSGGAKAGSGGSSSSGGSNGSGGSGTTGSGGSGTTGSGGSGTTGSGGSGTTGSGGSAGGSNGNPNCPADGSIISDFEEGTTATTINPKGGVWNGYIGMGTMTPTPVTTSMTPTGIATDPGSGTCMGALHIKTTGATDYSGFGATLAPAPKSGMLSFGNAVDASSHKGIKFKIKSGSGTPPAVYFDIKTKETAPMSEGGNLAEDSATNNPDKTIGLRNNRGQMLVSPWTPSSIGTDWTTITVPFGTLIPRWVPAAGSSNACPAPGTGVPSCQAPKFVPTDVLGIEFSVLSDAGFPKPSGSTAGTYDLWVDDVAWVDDDSGLPPQTGFPLTGAGSVGMCNKPTTADAKFLVTAYNLWKQTFAKNGAGPVIRPEASNDVVSEGIAYGMLIAVNMNDKMTFDNLYSYWKSKAVSGTNLMNWCQPSTGGGTGTACDSQGGGSATDADEDAAFALIQAAKVFGTASYMSDASTMIGQIWSHDIDSGSNLPTGGSNYGSTSSKVTNPSYFAPAYYRVFASMDSGHAWGTVADKSIAAINALSNANGLVPAWCSGDCKAVASNGGANDMIYQYDSHRVPMRVGLDYCWNGTAAAQQYVMKNTAFFATNAHAGKDGIGRIYDLYNLDSGGTSPSSAEPNSASIIGTAAVGAMASKSNQGFLDDAYQAVFDMATRATLAPVSSNMTPYSYYNATVGMLTLLMMTGNFSH